MTRGPLWDLGLVSASIFNYASACLMIILWEFELLYYIPIAFAISFMIGFLIVDVKKSVIYTYASMVLGNGVAIAAFLTPYVIYKESTLATNFAATIVLSVIAKLFMVTAIVYFLGAMLGCFLGEKSIKKMETE